MMISLVRAGTDDNSIPKKSKFSKIIKNSKKPQKDLFKKQIKKKENTANTLNIRMDNILNQLI